MDNLLSYLRLQAELEEAKEEARIQAQEEIVARIQEAKVIIIIAELWTSGKSMGLVTVHFFFFFWAGGCPARNDGAEANLRGEGVKSTWSHGEWWLF